ncbi:VapE domain-containing protein [Methylobacterium brachythecii]|nr:VapE domain-containing protein [Methylobacterium brachythecii]MBB3904741.1 hypothetical protein [Methylobacterium brachythecii]
MSNKHNSVKAVDFAFKQQNGDRIHLVAMPPDGRPTARTFEAAQRQEAVLWIESKQGSHNIYYSVAKLRGSAANKKAKKQDVESTMWLHVDIDDPAALEKIRAYEPAPTSVIFSGGGFQGLWLLNSVTSDLDRVERCNKALARALGGDNCHNCDRVMRLPWTINVPNKKKREAGRVPTLARVVEDVPGQHLSYDLDQFNEAPVAELSGGLTLESGKALVEPVSIEALKASIPEKIRKLIIHGDDAENPIGRPGAHFPSRSEAVFAVATALARSGCAQHEIAGILLNADYGISASIREKVQSQRHALRQADRAIATVNGGWPDMSKFGPRPTLRNTLLAIARLGLRCEYDEFHRRKKIGGQALQVFEGELSDDGCAVLRHEILREYNFDPGKDHTREAANTLCLENIFHPVRDYLDGLRWDGVARIDSWLVKYLGAENTPLNRAFGRIVLIASVRRIRQPGTKFDTILILEGSQGTGKSTALRILAGDQNFSDQDILTLDPKSQMEAVEGVWIYELGELEGLTRADMNKVKAFASRTVDQARPAYGRFRETRPRQNVFVGTTNDDQYLRDQTGNRRFWPVRTGAIALDLLAADRDQLWAEAAASEAHGLSIVLDEALWAAAAEQQNDRMEDDPWLDHLKNIGRGLDWERAHASEYVIKTGGYYRISTFDIFEKVLKLEPRAMPQYFNKRLAQLMRKIGWEGPQNIKCEGKVMKGYSISEDKFELNVDPDSIPIPI